MRPAFSSTKQAAAFALLLLVILLLPVAVGKNLLPSREEAYSAMSWGSGPYPYVQQQIFEETNDIDIAFVGSSHILHGIDTPYVEEQLSKKLGRQAVVRTIAWGGAGYDELYFVTQDLLQHRKVRLLVFYNEFQGRNALNNQIPLLFRFGENADVLDRLPLQLKANFYFAAILGMPRTLLSIARPNVPADLISANKNYQEVYYQAPNPASRLGSMSAALGYSPDYRMNNTNFIAYQPRSGAQPTDARIFSPATKADFEFSSGTVPGWQLHFARRFVALAREHGCQLVLLHIPMFDEAGKSAIPEAEFWPHVLGTNVIVLGVPSNKLFAGLTDDEVRKLFFNPGHLNQNGQAYFTPLITPALLQIYDFQTNH